MPYERGSFLEKDGFDLREIWEKFSAEQELRNSQKEFQSRRDYLGVRGDYWRIGKNFGFKAFFEIPADDPKEGIEIGHLVRENNGEIKATVAWRLPNWLVDEKKRVKSENLFVLMDIFTAGLNFPGVSSEILMEVFQGYQCATTNEGIDLYLVFEDESSFDQLGARGLRKFLFPPESP